jgi:hypothetical protein
MAKGKQAVETARRRAEAAHEVIDRLTGELADAKIRARDAERRAADVDLLRAQVAAQRNDVLLADAFVALQQWRAYGSDLHKARKRALSEMKGLIEDLDTAGLLNGIADRVEFMLRRYPEMMAVLCGRDHGTEFLQGTTNVRRLGDDVTKRVQRMVGERADLGRIIGPDADAADVLGDLLDAKQAGFSKSDVVEFVLGRRIAVDDEAVVYSKVGA